MSRKKLPIDPEQVVALAKLGATVKEIADFFHCSDATINNRFQGELVEGRAAMRISIRRAQLHLAVEKHNATMLVWLGKQYLQQAETQPVDVTANSTDYGKDQFQQEIKKLVSVKPDTDKKEDGSNGSN
jgi:hypothetical protein